MNILVTGASGFIGSNLCFYLHEKGHEVYPVCTHTCEVSDYFQKTSVYQGMFGFDTKVLKHCHGIIHLAANNDTLSVQNGEMLRANYYDSKKLLKLARRNYHKFFVYASSTAVYGKNSNLLREDTKARANSSYSKSKLKFDKDMLKDDPFIGWAGLRLCNVYGPNEAAKGRRSSYLGQMLQDMIDNKPIRLFEDGTQIRDWCYVKDVCQAFEKAIYTKRNGIYNVASGNSVSFLELFEVLKKVTGYTGEIQWISNKNAKQYQDSVVVCIEKSRELLGYEPEYNLEKGIQEYFEWKKTKTKHK